MRDSVVFYRSFYEAVKKLPPEQFKACVQAIMDYGLDDKEPEASGIEETVFLLVKPQIDANNKRYQNGTKGGRPPKHTEDEAVEAKKYRNSQEYIKWKDAVYERDNHTCVLCGATKDVMAHHKKGFIEYPALRYKISNGITLCRKCHNQVHKADNQKEPVNILEITESEPRNNHMVTENEPKEKDKEKEKDNVKDKKTYTCAFETLWDAYPRKKEKAGAYRCYIARLADGFSEDELETAVKRYAEECRKNKTDQRYIKLASTFLGPNTPFVDYLKGDGTVEQPGRDTEPDATDIVRRAIEQGAGAEGFQW